MIFHLRPLAFSLGVLLVSVAGASEPEQIHWSFNGDGDAAYIGSGSPGGSEIIGTPVGLAKRTSERGGSLSITGAGRLVIADTGEQSAFDRSNGDELTVEAWVNPDSKSLSSGRHLHIVGKGRTGNDEFPADNLNYAVRLTGKGGAAALSFVFRSADPKAEYHRWTSRDTIPGSTGWHHVAVSYRFGDPDSLRAVVDGRVVDGVWDMGGATTAAPVVDNDELWIGSGAGGGEGSSFQGTIDDVVLWNRCVPEIELQKRSPLVAERPSHPWTAAPSDRVLVEIFEGMPTKRTWDFRWPKADERYEQDSFGFTALPRKYSASAVQVDRTQAFALRASSFVDLPAGRYDLLLRSRNGSKLWVNGKETASTPFFSISGDAHGTIRDWRVVKDPQTRRVQPGDHEVLVQVESTGDPVELRVEMYVGGGNQRPETGEAGLFIRPQGETAFHLLGHDVDVSLTDAGMLDFINRQRDDLEIINASRRRAVDAEERAYWNQRHALARTVWSQKKTVEVPPPTDALPSDHPIDRFVTARLTELGETATEPLDDLAFLRRVTLDLIGSIPSREQSEAFFADDHTDRRTRYIDRLLDSPGWADHWVATWQDALAENPNLVNPTLNNTGPFRWWLRESFADNKPFDRFATELVLMEGSTRYGGPGGFELSTQNDVPMAAKAHILAQSLLAVDMSCARCHDSPVSDWKQADLFGMAAMLRRGPQVVPATSSVPPNDDPNHISLIEVTLPPGSKVEPHWSFTALSSNDLVPAELMGDPDDDRARLAALITSPHNDRFVGVIVNRVWKRYFGRGLVEPVHNWIDAAPADAALMDYLSREFVAGGYDLKSLARLIVTSQTYQSRPVTDPTADAAGLLPVRRRMTAEQIVDSMFVACGKRLKTGEVNIDADGAREFTNSLNLGRPRRAWEFTSLSNERDRPALSLPKVQPFVTLMEAFGWSGARQAPVPERDKEPNVLQPGLVANGVLARRFTRLSDDSAFLELALHASSPSELIDTTVRRVLGRPASDQEQALFGELLAEGFAERTIDAEPLAFRDYTTTGVSWSNHLHPDATRAQKDLQDEVAAGDPPTPRLNTDWRECYEDMLWSLLNSPEFVFLP
jgi:hypothetical protein